MKLADTNVWLALVFSKHVFHDAAQTWLDTETTAREVVFCRATQQSFLRLLTTAAMVKPYGAPPFSNAGSRTRRAYASTLATNASQPARERPVRQRLKQAPGLASSQN